MVKYHGIWLTYWQLAKVIAYRVYRWFRPTPKYIGWYGVMHYPDTITIHIQNK